MPRRQTGDETRSKAFSVRVTPATYDDLAALSLALDIPVAEFTAKLINEGIERYTDETFIENLFAEQIAKLDQTREKLLRLKKSRSFSA